MEGNNQSELSKPAVRRVTAFIGAVVLVIGILLFADRNPGIHKLELKAYFSNAKGLQVGAPVRVSGVDVGMVTAVRVRPERRHAAAEVLMRLNTPYALHIPKDAVAEIATAGVLGETLININISKASGAPAQNGDELQTTESTTRSGEFELYFGSRRKESKDEISLQAQKSASTR